jgi:hypothetical protein
LIPASSRGAAGLDPVKEKPVARSILRGDSELRRALKGIPDVTSRGLDKAVKDSLEPMRRQTMLNALRLRQPGTSPRGGHLDQGVVVQKVDGRSKVFRTFWVSLTKRARYLGHLVEWGTAPHWQPRRRGGIMHPGARPRPFATPAYETWALIERAALTFGRRSK